MLYSIKGKNYEYEQYYEVIVIAETPEEALREATETFELAKNWVSPWRDQELYVEEINLNAKGVIASLIA